MRLRACGLNRLDLWVHRGWPGLEPEILHWRGADVAGEIAALGEGAEGWDLAEAAAPLLVGLAAWRMLIQQARLRAGEAIMIIGASGGVSPMAIQIAKLAGASQYALTSSEEKMAKACASRVGILLNYIEDPSWNATLCSMTSRRGVEGAGAWRWLAPCPAPSAS